MRAENEAVGVYEGREAVPPYPWLAGIFLGTMLLSLAWGLAAAQWTRGLHVLAWATLAGWASGQLLGYVRWPRWFSRVYTLIVGLAVTLHLCATLVAPTLTGLQREIEVIARLLLWVRTVAGGGQSADSLVFVADVTFALWWLSLDSTERLIRDRSVWHTIVIVGLLHILNAHYAPTHLNGFVIIYLASALLLLVSHHLDEQMIRWEHFRVRYSPDIVVDYLRYGAILTGLLLLLAWVLPPPNTQAAADRWLSPAQRPWRALQEEWHRLFGTLTSGAPSSAVPVFTRGFDFQGTPHLTDTPYFRIQAERGRYWRSATYDVYRSTGWDSTLGEEQTLPAGTSLTPPALYQTTPLTQTVIPLLEGMVSLVAAPTPIQFSVSAQAYILTYPQGGREIVLAYAQHPIPARRPYTVVSLISRARADDLRRAPTTYPPWLYRHFTQLPETLPSRVRELAESITASFDTPYDRLRALETYLRSIPYNEDIPAPPKGRDAVDWFLFEERQGYCDYYASAFAVMARAIGIPARVAGGYARGLFDPQTHTWLVRENDAHTWPEVWFPGYGWIPFEPTPSEPPLNRGDEAPSPYGEDIPLWERERLERERNIPEDVNVPNTPRQGTVPLPLWRRRALPLYAFLLPFLLLLAYALYRRYRPLRSGPTVPQIYRHLVRWARRLGIPITPAWTPQEVGSTLGGRVPALRPWILDVVRVYQAWLYAPADAKPPESVVSDLQAAWSRARYHLYRAWIQSLIQRPRFPIPRLHRPF